MKNSKDSLHALRQKFPCGIPIVSSLSEEQKAWLHMTIQSLADGLVPFQTLLQLQKIRNRLLHATEDVPDEELQKIVSFVFDNMDEIQKFIK